MVDFARWYKLYFPITSLPASGVGSPRDTHVSKVPGKKSLLEYLHKMFFRAQPIVVPHHGVQAWLFCASCPQVFFVFFCALLFYANRWLLGAKNFRGARRGIPWGNYDQWWSAPRDRAVNVVKVIGCNIVAPKNRCFSALLFGGQHTLFFCTSFHAWTKNFERLSFFGKRSVRKLVSRSWLDSMCSQWAR